jgi:hypothetical protein
MNKKGKKGQMGNQITIFVFFFLLMIVAAGIVIGVFMFYGKPYDFRYVDANVETYVIKKCLIDSLSGNPIDWSNPDNFYGRCNLNKEVFQREMTLRIIENNKELIRWKNPVGCDLASKNIKFPRCVYENFSIENLQGIREYQLLVGSNQNSRRVET